MVDELIQKYHKIIDSLKDGESVKIKRDTVLKGRTKPFGTLTRRGDIIKYEPAKGMPGYAESMASEKAARRLADIDLLASFSF